MDQKSYKHGYDAGRKYNQKYMDSLLETIDQDSAELTENYFEIERLNRLKWGYAFIGAMAVVVAYFAGTSI